MGEINSLVNNRSLGSIVGMDQNVYYCNSILSFRGDGANDRHIIEVLKSLYIGKSRKCIALASCYSATDKGISTLY